MCEDSKPNDGGPAFPSEQGETQEGSWNQTYQPGMSLRDWFAGIAIQGLLASGPHDCTYEELAIESFDIANSMINQREN